MQIGADEGPTATCMSDCDAEKCYSCGVRITNVVVHHTARKMFAPYIHTYKFASSNTGRHLPYSCFQACELQSGSRWPLLFLVYGIYGSKGGIAVAAALHAVEQPQQAHSQLLSTSWIYCICLSNCLGILRSTLGPQG